MKIAALNSRLLAVGCAVLLSGVAGEAALGETYETLYKTCYASSLPDRVIASCSLLIRRRLASGDDLATAFKNRGNAYDDKGDHGLAVADYGQALAINPQDADTTGSRKPSPSGCTSASVRSSGATPRERI